MSRVEFVLIAEQGSLETQALLCCASIRTFGGDMSNCRITAVSPRPARRPSRATVKGLERLQVDYVEADIESCCPDYGPSYRVHVAALVERRPGPEVIIQLDSDTIFVSEPDPSLFAYDATARPVDIKGMCTVGQSDPLDSFWRRLCILADVEYEQLPIIRTTVDGVAVRASYNGGLLAARRSLGLFARTETIFEALVAEQMHPWTAEGPPLMTGTGLLSGSATAFWGTSQAAFSLAAVAGQHSVTLLPPSYNFPLHSLNDIMTPIPRRLVHLHYHWLLHEPTAAMLLQDSRLSLSTQAIEWLTRRVPLRV